MPVERVPKVEIFAGQFNILLNSREIFAQIVVLDNQLLNVYGLGEVEILLVVVPLLCVNASNVVVANSKVTAET